MMEMEGEEYGAEGPEEEALEGQYQD